MLKAYVPVSKVPGQPGKYYNSEGYVLVWVSKGRFELEHRVKAEQALGRPLKTHEVVHHVDGVRSNNANSNLLVCSIRYHLLLHERCKVRYGRWHLPRVRDPYMKSMQILRKGLPLNGQNPVASMFPPWDEGRDTATSKNSAGGARAADPPQTVASILRELLREESQKTTS